MNDLGERLFDFAIRTIKYVRTLPDSSEFKIIKYQLTKSSTSSGANYSPCQIVSKYGWFLLCLCFIKRKR